MNGGRIVHEQLKCTALGSASNIPIVQRFDRPVNAEWEARQRVDFAIPAPRVITIDRVRCDPEDLKATIGSDPEASWVCCLWEENTCADVAPPNPDGIRTFSDHCKKGGVSSD